MDEDARAWLSARTFPASPRQLPELLDLKGSTRISVVVPARNEADTLGPILTGIRRTLMDDVPLVDELLVIDSDSTDGTVLIAQESGATVHSAAHIRPDLGWAPGKGEAMWKSMFVCSGDIIVFIDGDLTEFTNQYVPALVGPMLQESQIKLVKGFTQRDLTVAGLEAPGLRQGGRVTELTARPLINLWWPGLAGLIQPLAGEWAVRRDLLDSLPIPCGYGVEFAVLVDTYERHGLAAIAQVHLGVRAHAHQDLAGLGVMAAEIIQAASRRRFGQVSTSEVIVHPKASGDFGEVQAPEQSINARERPPQRTVTGQG